MTTANNVFKNPWLQPGTCVLIVLAFLLPFCNFKCGNVKIATVQGIDMVTGGKPETMKGPGKLGNLTDRADRLVDSDQVKANIWVIAALAAAAAGLGIYFIPFAHKQKALLGVAAAGIICLMAFAFTKNSFFDLAKISKGEDGTFRTDSPIRVGLDAGWWVALLGFAGLGYVSWSRLQDKPKPATGTVPPPAT